MNSGSCSQMSPSCKYPTYFNFENFRSFGKRALSDFFYTVHYHWNSFRKNDVVIITLANGWFIVIYCEYNFVRSDCKWTGFWLSHNDWMLYYKPFSCSSHQGDLVSCNASRLLSRIYFLGEKSELPREAPGAWPPENVLKWICAEMQSGAIWDTILR